ASVGGLVSFLAESFPEAEILVVDDNSTDGTIELAQRAGAKVIQHKYNMGNGAGIKTGARNAKGDVLVFMDADGQHDPKDISRLLQGIDEGYDLVIGARESDTQASKGRWLGNKLLNRFASLLTGRRIPDLTSGFRAVRADTFREFIHLLPNGFSYPTTSTMAYLRSGYPVSFIPIRAGQRKGRSKISFIRDGIRFMVVIMKVATLFSPMRFFFPASVLFFLTGLLRYIYFYWITGAFSEIAGVMFITAILVFLIGLISEQITALHYGISSRKINSDWDE
ncbi:MAG: glycosyltransferase family 2 protein, partial [Gammaproteobacteria bacterium]|nr:glycosyltransferase family 2 protein [Gammaproteobacteria bacterium]